MNHQVFISYSSKDRNVADKVLAMLESRNIKCWMAPRDIIGGVEYGDVIDEAILNCKAVVVIFSAHSQQSQWVKGELNLGFTHNKAIVPYRIDNTVLQGAMRLILNDKHWIDANPSTDYKWNDLLEAVAVALEISMPEQVASPNKKRKKTTLALISIILIAAIVTTAFVYKNRQKSVLLSNYQALVAQGDSLQQSRWQNFQPALSKYQAATEMEKSIPEKNLLQVGEKITSLQTKIDSLFYLYVQAGDESVKLYEDYYDKKDAQRAVSLYQDALILKETETVKLKLNSIKNDY